MPALASAGTKNALTPRTIFIVLGCVAAIIVIGIIMGGGEDARATAGVTQALCVMAAAGIAYFAPALVAWKKPQFGSVMALNFFLGWTIVFWVVALAWALKNDTPVQVIAYPSPAVVCRDCGKYSLPSSAFCSICGAKL
jgi:hypothetical protein